MQFKLHLIGRTVENQAGTVDRNSNASNSTRSLFDFFVRFLRSIWGGCPTRRGVSHETEANHANCALSSTGSWTRSINLEKQGHRSGRTGPSTEYRPRRLKKIEAVANPVFHPSLPPKPHEHRPGDDFAQKFDRCIRVAAGRVGLWGDASPPKTSQER